MNEYMESIYTQIWPKGTLVNYRPAWARVLDFLQGMNQMIIVTNDSKYDEIYADNKFLYDFAFERYLETEN